VDTERNAGIASVARGKAAAGALSQDMTGCSRVTVAKIAKRFAVA